jgi:hypothetical protein
MRKPQEVRTRAEIRNGRLSNWNQIFHRRSQLVRYITTGNVNAIIVISKMSRTEFVEIMGRETFYFTYTAN